MSRIDFHVHVTPPEISANIQKYAKKEKYFALLSKNPHSKFATAEDVIAAFQGEVVDHAVIFGFAFKDHGLCRLVNDYVIEKVRQFPEKLTGFISVSPNARETEKEIDRCYAAGLKGVGEIYPVGQGFNIDGKKDTKAVATACIERNIPLIVHVNEPVGHHYIGKNNVPLQKIERFIENSQALCPKHGTELRVVLAHWGGGLLFYEAMPELRKKFRNVYYDTAATPFLYDASIYRAALALGLGEKIVFGSDFPLLPVSRYMPPLETLPPVERELILGGNAQRWLVVSG
jgi:predicted TIM-barrel fold metal-dependent hydrolase